MNSVELVGRMLLALGVVLGVMWALARFARRPLTGKSDRIVTVLARQQLNRNASVAVLKVADRALVVGVTDQGVRLLTETNLDTVEQMLTRDSPRKTGHRGAPDALDFSAVSSSKRSLKLQLDRAPDLATASRMSLGPIVDAPAVSGLEFAQTAERELAMLLATDEQTRGNKRREHRAVSSALHGSVLSPKVWSQVLNVARNATVRR